MHVLLVEDNRADALLLLELLKERSSSVELSWVTDGLQALDFIFRRGKFVQSPVPVIVVLDLGLPLLSGHEVLAALRAEPVKPKTPVLILSTSDSALDRDQCLANGAIEYISKPRDLDGYEELVTRLIGVEFPRADKMRDAVQ
jgi:CheY-like chemotaxis protein